MNIAQAKRIPIEDYLSRLGMEPAKCKDGQLWYSSPLRNEDTPSFKVNTERNAWYDFGVGQGGDILDLAKAIEHVPSISEALLRIEATMRDATRSWTKPQALTTHVETPDIICVKPVAARSLVSYLASRGIGLQTALPYLKEVHYRRHGKDYFALGLANQRGGFELRSKHFKGSIGEKDITIIEGSIEHAIVFEGMFDFLTLVSRDGLPDATIIVLNSVALKQKGLQGLSMLLPNSIDVYRDNDDAGRELFDYFKKALPNTNIFDCSAQYEGFEDFNAWHVATCERALLPQAKFR